MSSLHNSDQSNSEHSNSTIKPAVKIQAHHQNYQSMNTNKPQRIEVKPRIPGIITLFTILSIPSFLTSLIWLVVVFMLVIFAFSGGMEGEEVGHVLEYNTVSSDSSTNDSILVYDLVGEIQSGDVNTPDYLRQNGIYTAIVKKDFEVIKNDKDIKAVVFRMNTPGGTVFASQELGQLMQDLLANKNQTEAIYHFEQLVASGGLWASMSNPNNYIYGSQYGLTGSIGVIMTLPNLSGLADKVGYSQTVIKSGVNKGVGDPFEPVTVEQTNFLQNQVNTIYNDFVNIVSKGRKLSIEQTTALANGFLYDNQEAQKLGLIDQIGTTSDAISRAAEKQGLTDGYNVLEVVSQTPFLNSLFGSTALAELLGISNSAKTVEKVFSIEAGKPYLLDPNYS